MPKSVKLIMREGKLISDVHWKGALKRKGIKQTSLRGDGGWVNLFVTNVKECPAEPKVSNSPCYVARIQKCLQSLDTVWTVPHLIIPILFLCHWVLSYTQSKAGNPSLSQFPFWRYYDKKKATRYVRRICGQCCGRRNVNSEDAHCPNDWKWLKFRYRQAPMNVIKL
jgi:hypothetical protein